MSRGQGGSFPVLLSAGGSLSVLSFSPLPVVRETAELRESGVIFPAICRGLLVTERQRVLSGSRFPGKETEAKREERSRSQPTFSCGHCQDVLPCVCRPGHSNFPLWTSFPLLFGSRLDWHSGPSLPIAHAFPLNNEATEVPNRRCRS